MIYIDAQDAQDFFGKRLACNAEHQQIRTHDHCPSRHLVQQRPLLVILCILCIDVNDEPFLFVFIGVHSWFILYTQSAVFPRMFRPAG